MDDTISLILRETGMKRRRCHVPLPQALDLVLHESNERRNNQGQPWQKRRRQLVAERLSLTGRHDRHDIAPGQDRADGLLLSRPKLRKAELLFKLSSEIVHGESKLDGAFVIRNACGV